MGLRARRQPPSLARCTHPHAFLRLLLGLAPQPTEFAKYYTSKPTAASKAALNGEAPGPGNRRLLAGAACGGKWNYNFRSCGATCPANFDWRRVRLGVAPVWVAALYCCCPPPVWPWRPRTTAAAHTNGRRERQRPRSLAHTPPPARRRRRTVRSGARTTMMSPVHNQGSCASCWAMAATAATVNVWLQTYSWQMPNAIDLSERQLMACTAGNGCVGGNAGDALH